MALHFDKSPYGRQNSYPTSPGNFREVPVAKGSRKKKTQIAVSNPVDLDYTELDVAVQALADAGAGLQDAQVTVDTWDDYGSERVSIMVAGWRDATPQEIEDRDDFNNWHKMQQETRVREAEEAVIAKLRVERPELFTTVISEGS